MEIRNISEDVYRVISEPGDATHYDYIVYEDGGTFHFCAAHSAIRYPHTLEWWEVKNADEEDIHKLAVREHCNPYTVAECARTALTLMNGGEEIEWPTFGLQYRSS
jgi:hypothetical protein